MTAAMHTGYPLLRFILDGLLDRKLSIMPLCRLILNKSTARLEAR